MSMSFGATGPIHVTGITTGHYTSPNINWTTTSNTTVIGPPIADTVSVTADGMLLVDAGGLKIKVPPYLFKDLVALAEMGLLEKMVVPEGADAK